MKKNTMQTNNDNKYQLRRRMRIMLIILAIIFGAIFIYKMFMHVLLNYLMSHQSPVVTVSTTKVGYSDWEPRVKAIGSVRAIKGVNVTTELAGTVRQIFFTPGSVVEEGALLVELNVDADVAQLKALQANAELAKITYKRDKAQYAIKGISKEALDTSAANVKNLVAQVNQQIATVQKKIIHAPFSGHLGISAVNPGQYLNPGDTVVPLQQLDPIYVDFFVPQQTLRELKVGQTVTIENDVLPGKKFTGKITTINPVVDTQTRNVEVEATLPNPDHKLVPGMFVNVSVETGEPSRYLTLPQTAISFNPYGDVVFIVKPPEGAKKNKWVVQSFVETGETRGEQVAITKGLKAGDEVVTSGQLKLKNGFEIKVDNSVVPSNSPNPVLPNEH